MGCNTLQGYAFAQALPEAELFEFLDQYKPVLLQDSESLIA